MTTDIEPINTQASQPMPLELTATFGQRLQSARTAMNMESKDAASHLRLNEKIILMMENNNFNNDIAPTFMKGYIRSYAKLLNIPEDEVKQVTDTIKQEPSAQRVTTKPVAVTHRNTDRVTNHFMNIFTALIVFTMVGLIGTWWYSHNKPGSIAIAANQVSHMLNTVDAPLPIQIAAADTTPTAEIPVADTPAPAMLPAEALPAAQPSNGTPAASSNTTNKPAKTEPRSTFDDDDDLDGDI